MKYTLTRANPDADQYPLQDRQIVTDPLEEEVNKSVMMTRLEDVLHTCIKRLTQRIGRSLIPVWREWSERTQCWINGQPIKD